jgi:hypothetical protein
MTLDMRAMYLSTSSIDGGWMWGDDMGTDSKVRSPGVSRGFDIDGI